MARVNLSIDDELFQKLEDDAKEHDCTVNVHIISILERLYKENPFDYQKALQQLIAEADKMGNGKEFTLVELPSFADICVARAENAGIKPSIVRARLGKMFNSWVRDNNDCWIKRQKNEKGELKFVCRAAVYVIDKTVNGARKDDV